jgi:hypothetical protein
MAVYRFRSSLPLSDATCLPILTSSPAILFANPLGYGARGIGFNLDQIVGYPEHTSYRKIRPPTLTQIKVGAAE